MNKRMRITGTAGETTKTTTWNLPDGFRSVPPRTRRNSVFRLAAVLGAFVVIALLAGCAGLQRTAVEKRHYDLRPERAERLTAPAGAPDLRLRRVRVSPLCDGREMVVRTGDAAFASDYYNTWFVPPADMFTQGVREWLNGSGLFAHVLDETSLAGARLTLEGTVNALYGDYAGAAPEAVVEMQFLLLDEGGARNEILFSRSYVERTPLEARTPASLAVGLRTGAAAILGRLERDLATLPILRPTVAPSAQ